MRFESLTVKATALHKLAGHSIGYHASLEWPQNSQWYKEKERNTLNIPQKGLLRICLDCYKPPRRAKLRYVTEYMIKQREITNEWVLLGRSKIIHHFHSGERTTVCGQGIRSNTNCLKMRVPKGSGSVAILLKARQQRSEYSNSDDFRFCKTCFIFTD